MPKTHLKTFKLQKTTKFQGELLLELTHYSDPRDSKHTYSQPATEETTTEADRQNVQNGAKVFLCQKRNSDVIRIIVGLTCKFLLVSTK